MRILNKSEIQFTKISIAFLALSILISCNMFNKKPKGKQARSLFFVGTYTNGESEGIYSFALNKRGIIKPLGLAATSDNPSFLAMSADKKYLLAVSETMKNNGMGSVETYRVAGKKLKRKSQKPSGGAHPCFVSINLEGDILVANYTGGNVGLLKLGKNGKLSDLLDVEQHEGKGTTDRQEGPYAHSAWFEPDGSGIISADLGTNELWFSEIDKDIKKLIQRNPQNLAMAPGAGPRHLAFHPNQQWIYVLNELDNTITLIDKDEKGKYTIGPSISTLPTDYDQFSKSAHIEISADGKYIYASNRGHNSIAIFEVNPDTGLLKLLAFEPTLGDEPRHFALSPDESFLVVANQNSNNLVSFKRDKSTGFLKFVGEVEVPDPVCVVFQ